VIKSSGQFVTNNNMVIVLQSPYSLDLVSCVLALFPKLKIKLRSDIQREAQVVLDIITRNGFNGAFRKVEKNNGIAVYTPKETILKEKTAITE
jgi:hypothetical protein